MSWYDMYLQVVNQARIKTIWNKIVYACGTKMNTTCVANICPNERIKINIMIKWKRLIEKVLKNYLKALPFRYLLKSTELRPFLKDAKKVTDLR